MTVASDPKAPMSRSLPRQTPVDAIDAIDAEPRPVGGHRAGFWRRPWVWALIPLATSLGIHAALVAIALTLLASGAFHYIVQRVTQPQVHVPTATLAETDIGGVPNVGNMDDVTSANAQLVPVEQSRNHLPQGEGESLQALASSGGPAPSNGLTGISGVGSLAEALGGGGEGSPLFGEAGGGGRFMGLDFGRAGDGGMVTRIVFVCDASGSMAGKPQHHLIKELQDSVGPLRPNQFYNIIFFGNEDVQPVFDGLISASPKNFQATRERLKRVVFAAGSNPIPALEAAFKLKPQLIFFLTDGEFNTSVAYEDVLATIRQRNKDKQARINTIQFRSRDEQAERVLHTIAQESKGLYEFIKAAD